jgi:hemerythrin-like domain-containing protein
MTPTKVVYNHEQHRHNAYICPFVKQRKPATMTQQVDLPIAEYLNRNIKDILREFPPVADVLNEYDIGCVSCGLGTCLFKDIVEIHDLPPEDEVLLMTGIAGIIFPGREITVPAIQRKSRTPTGGAYSPPMKKLVDEHRLIKRFIAVIPAFAGHLDVATESGREIIRQAIDFIRSYADKYHHAKEEAILFKYFDENLDIIKTMYADHENGRAHVREMLGALDRQDKETIAGHLRAYRDLLTEHIRKEDDILYRWMDRNLSTGQVGRLYASFGEKDGEAGDLAQKYEPFITAMEQKYNTMEGVNNPPAELGGIRGYF